MIVLYPLLMRPIIWSERPTPCCTRVGPSGLLLIACLLFAVTSSQPAHASGKAQAVRETVDYVLKKFGKEAAEEGSERLAAQTESLAFKHGDEVFAAVKKTGPRGLKLIEQAGPNGQEAARLLGKFGDDARAIVANPSRLALAGKYGDEAAQAMINTRTSRSRWWPPTARQAPRP